MHRMYPAHATTARPLDYFADWYHAVECLGFSETFIGAFTSNQVEYDRYARPSDDSLRKLYYDLLRESEDYYFATQFTEETIAGDLGEKLAAIRLHLHPNLAGVLTHPSYLYILENLPVQLCVVFLLEAMLRLRTHFINNSDFRTIPVTALRTSPADLVRLFEAFDLRTRIADDTDGVKENVEYIVID